ncbi:SPOR domain-containing protein [Arenimonas sp.]|uniref:SPOR domain-containing protein n=1 Tax=Arenimonas sp. TaxID=1872635 RepID=UPI0025C21638|nr:SPOR domain-containing protein [Arenimonas sp.]
MDSALKQRLIGAAVLVALAMIFLPMLLKGPDTTEPDAARVPLDMPAAPDQAFETREVPLTLPAPEAPDGGVLGMDTRPPATDDPNAVATVDQTGLPPARTDVEPEPEDAPAMAVDAATGLPEPAPAPAAAAPTPAPVTATSEPAPVVAPAPVEPALPASTAGGRYVVNVGSFSNLANARSLADKLRSRGLPLTSESVDVGGKPAMRLRVGPYGDRTAAEAARLRVESVTGGSAAVVALDAASSSPAPAPARASTAATVGFAVQLGALSSEADANALRDRARAAGFIAFHQRVNTDRGAVWRVRVGPEADRAAADRLRDAVRSQLGLPDAIVVPHP